MDIVYRLQVTGMSVFLHGIRLPLFIQQILILSYAALASNVRQKRQEEDADTDDQSVDELCENRPPDEYFRLSTEGDCRDVVRYIKLCHQYYDI
jgi:hypothetical protein